MRLKSPSVQKRRYSLDGSSKHRAHRWRGCAVIHICKKYSEGSVLNIEELRRFAKNLSCVHHLQTAAWITYLLHYDSRNKSQSKWKISHPIHEHLISTRTADYGMHAEANNFHWCVWRFNPYIRRPMSSLWELSFMRLNIWEILRENSENSPVNLVTVLQRGPRESGLKVRVKYQYLKWRSLLWRTPSEGFQSLLPFPIPSTVYLQHEVTTFGSRMYNSLPVGLLLDHYCTAC